MRMERQSAHAGIPLPASHIPPLPDSCSVTSLSGIECNTLSMCSSSSQMEIVAPQQDVEGELKSPVTAKASRKRKRKRRELSDTLSKPTACNMCSKVRTRCDGDRPCGRCVRLGREHMCKDRPPRKLGRPRGKRNKTCKSSANNKANKRRKAAARDTTPPTLPMVACFDDLPPITAASISDCLASANSLSTSVPAPPLQHPSCLPELCNPVSQATATASLPSSGSTTSCPMVDEDIITFSTDECKSVSNSGTLSSPASPSTNGGIPSPWTLTITDPVWFDSTKAFISQLASLPLDVDVMRYVGCRIQYLDSHGNLFPRKEQYLELSKLAYHRLFTRRQCGLGELAVPHPRHAEKMDAIRKRFTDAEFGLTIIPLFISNTQVVYANPYLSELTGRPLLDLLSRLYETAGTNFSLLPDDEHDRLFLRTRTALVAGKSGYTCVHNFVNTQSGRMPVVNSRFFVRDDEGCPVALVCLSKQLPGGLPKTQAEQLTITQFWDMQMKSHRAFVRKHFPVQTAVAAVTGNAPLPYALEVQQLDKTIGFPSNLAPPKCS